MPCWPEPGGTGGVQRNMARLLGPLALTILALGAGCTPRSTPPGAPASTEPIVVVFTDAPLEVEPPAAAEPSHSAPAPQAQALPSEPSATTAAAPPEPGTPSSLGQGDPLDDRLWIGDDDPYAEFADEAADESAAAPRIHRRGYAAPSRLHVPTATASAGRLPPEIIQYVIRNNMGRFRGCYAAGLLRRPALRGRVTTHFVIARSGSVVSARAAQVELADPEVVRCIVEAFGKLTFPPPAHAAVEVTYPLRLRPRDTKARRVASTTSLSP